jgi:hypothetical protein
MPNRLDDISRVIGNIEAEVRGLSASIADVRHSAAEQHGENRQRLECIGAKVEKIEADMKPLAKTVATMEPIVAGYAVTRWKIAGAFALGTTLITTLGWIVSLFAGTSPGFFRCFARGIWYQAKRAFAESPLQPVARIARRSWTGALAQFSSTCGSVVLNLLGP